MLGMHYSRPDRFSLAFGERLRATRRMRGMTRDAVVAALAAQGFRASLRSLARWEDGDTDPTCRQLVALGRVYRVEPGLWFDALWRRALWRRAVKAGSRRGLEYHGAAIKP